MSIYFAYPGTVWAVCWQAMNWLAPQIEAALNSSVSPPYAATVQVYATLLNGVTAIDAWQAAQATANEEQNLLNVETLFLSLDPTTQSYFNARIAAVTAAATGLALLPPALNPVTTLTLLNNGSVAIPDPGYIPWCMTFSGETPPAGLSATNLVADAQAAATAWMTVANAILTLQGGPVSQAYDTAQRMYRASNQIATFMNDWTSGPPANFGIISAQAAWNASVALPSILLDASEITSAPYTAINQQSGVICNTLLTVVAQLGSYIMALNQPTASNIATAPLMQSDSLQDFSARNTGNFENWPAVAQTNGLLPPYPGASVQTASGQTLLLPGSAVPVSGAPVLSYANNVLGVDYDMGPVNGVMPAWAGDYNLIAGYPNLQRALGRRLQTPLAAFIYDSTYGSRIPLEVGAVQTTAEAARLAQFGEGALIADPRVGSVIAAAAELLPAFGASFSGVVQPIGPGAIPVGVLSTIVPAT